jgi:hypothetical protein
MKLYSGYNGKRTKSCITLAFSSTLNCINIHKGRVQIREYRPLQSNNLHFSKLCSMLNTSNTQQGPTIGLTEKFLQFEQDEIDSQIISKRQKLSRGFSFQIQ